jgi:hypothetical protein
MPTKRSQSLGCGRISGSYLPTFKCPDRWRSQACSVCPGSLAADQDRRDVGPRGRRRRRPARRRRVHLQTLQRGTDCRDAPQPNWARVNCRSSRLLCVAYVADRHTGKVAARSMVVTVWPAGCDQASDGSLMCCYAGERPAEQDWAAPSPTWESVRHWRTAGETARAPPCISRRRDCIPSRT